MNISGCKFTGIIIVLSLLSSTSLASDQPAQWGNWRFRIDQDKCELSRIYRIGSAGDEASKGFLSGTDYTHVMFQIVAFTHPRYADDYHIGQSIFGVKIWSHFEKEPEDQLALFLFGGKEKEAAEKSKWSESDKKKQAFSGFWFHGAEADELITRLAQEETLPLTFVTGTGQKLIETEYQPRKRDRFRAWSEAFRACTVANQE